MKKFPSLFTIAVLVSLSAVLLSGCQKRMNPASSSATSTETTLTNTADQSMTNVVIQNMAYTPKDIQIKVGQTVIWTNNDNFSHTVTADGTGQFDSGKLTKGEAFSFTFTDEGTFAYHCHIHPGMTGKVTVVK